MQEARASVRSIPHEFEVNDVSGKVTSSPAVSKHHLMQLPGSSAVEKKKDKSYCVNLNNNASNSDLEFFNNIWSHST